MSEQEVHIHPEASNQRKRNILIIVLVVVTALACGFGGLIAGGVVGYLAGRNARLGPAPQNLEFEPIPEWRYMPEVPETPQIPDMPEIDFRWGAEVQSVTEGSPADEAGLRRGDFITHLDGQELEPTMDLAGTLIKFSPGDDVVLTVVRDDYSLDVAVTLGQARDRGRSIPYLGVAYSMGVRFLDTAPTSPRD